VEIGYDSGILFGDWFTAEYGGAPCNNSYVINNTPPVSVTITPTPPVAENSTVAIAWASNNASSCTYNNGIPLPNTNGSANVVATPANAITYTVTCLGPLGENNYGPVGTPGSASATLTLLCGAQSIIDEYPAYSVGFTPVCSDFTQTRQSVYFSFAELNTGDFTRALIADSLIAPASLNYGLDKFRVAFGGSRIINSAYRNPARNAAVGGATNSRHVYGDAADVRNVSGGQVEWDLMRDAMQAANAGWIEPLNGPCGLSCVHGDWRQHFVAGGGYYQ
jgi:hypothetical protein